MMRRRIEEDNEEEEDDAVEQRVLVTDWSIPFVALMIPQQYEARIFELERMFPDHVSVQNLTRRTVGFSRPLLIPH